MSVECFAATRCQEGRSINQDAFLITRGAAPLIAVCDGAGQAQQVARRALGFLERLFKEADAESVPVFPTWVRWARTLDSALRGGLESTLVAVGGPEGRIIDTCIGDPTDLPGENGKRE